MLYRDALMLIEAIKRHGYKPNGWEANFIRSIEVFQPETLTYKQTRTLEIIYAKASGGGQYQQRQRIR